MSEPTNPEVAIQNAALEFRPVERAAYLDQTCARDGADLHDPAWFHDTLNREASNANSYQFRKPRLFCVTFNPPKNK